MPSHVCRVRACSPPTIVQRVDYPGRNQSPPLSPLPPLRPNTYVHLYTYAACIDEDPSFRFAAWSDTCSDACYCSATCAEAYGFFNEYDLYSLKQVRDPHC